MTTTFVRSYLRHPGSDPEEGSEGEHGNELQGESQLLDGSFPLQQVLGVAHEVFLAE